jgi:dihydrofolate synthase/folylpolyglutamate synthase
MSNSASVFYSFPRVIDLSLERMKAAIAQLPGLIDGLPPIIHVAGTNGKGSTIAFLRAILTAAGKKCHIYTSPHLVTIHERYVISDKQIDEDALFKYATRVKEITNQIPLTIFEAETLAGFLAFSENHADYLLLETGLGGRLDATNAVDKKLLTILTPIDYDHKEFLGDDLDGIAREKCGILRANTPVIVGRQNATAFDAIENEAEKIGAKPYFFGRDWDCYQSYGKTCFQTNDVFIELPKPSLHGAHQYENAGNAIMAAQLLGIDEGEIAKGIKSAVWAARMQPLTSGIYAEIANRAGAELWLDGGHNPHGAISAKNFIASLPPKPLVLITGQLANKDSDGFFKIFAELNPFVITIPIKSTPNAATPENLAAIAKHHNLKAIPMNDAKSAVELAASKYNDARVLICGSLYLAGEILGEV